jgi:DNA ligase-1
MKRFAVLYDQIDRTTSTNAKVAAITAYIGEVPPADAAWALFFLTGRRLKRHLATRLMHEWTQELTALPDWLLEHCYSTVGDFAEAIALLLDGRIQPLSPEDVRRTTPQRDEVRLPFDEPSAPEIDERIDGVSLADWIEARILPLRDLEDEEKRVRVMTWWSRLPRMQVFLLNKLLTGEFRVGVSHTLVVRAVAQHAGLATAVVEHRLMGHWAPSAEAFTSLIAPEDPAGDPSRPYPFCLASPHEGPIEELGAREEWLVEWKWDGIRAQLIHRAGEVFLWSRGEELITERFPEIAAAASNLPAGTVLDGEVLAFGDGMPRPFADLQRRIGRQRKVQEVAGAVPVVFLAYDVLEHDGVDIRELPMRERRARLLRLLQADLKVGLYDKTQADLKVGLYDKRGDDERGDDKRGDDERGDDKRGDDKRGDDERGDDKRGDDKRGDDKRGVEADLQVRLRVSEALTAPTWEALASLRGESRERHVEGLMLKRWTSPYRPGRRRGDWWKWKIAPHTVDAVLLYAQPGSGRRASLFTDYTFGVWDNGELVPVAKAYSGLTDAEIDELDRWVRRHTTQRFGPVSAVEPVHVFELGFERIAPSTRHKSGVAVRFPRMLRWRRDKTAAEADTLDTLRTLIAR